MLLMGDRALVNDAGGDEVGTGCLLCGQGAKTLPLFVGTGNRLQLMKGNVIVSFDDVAGYL